MKMKLRNYEIENWLHTTVQIHTIKQMYKGRNIGGMHAPYYSLISILHFNWGRAYVPRHW